jgi:hypothetical protein
VLTIYITINVVLWNFSTFIQIEINPVFIRKKQKDLTSVGSACNPLNKRCSLAQAHDRTAIYSQALFIILKRHAERLARQQPADKRGASAEGSLPAFIPITSRFIAVS